MDLYFPSDVASGRDILFKYTYITVSDKFLFWSDEKLCRLWEEIQVACNSSGREKPTGEGGKFSSGKRLFANTS